MKKINRNAFNEKIIHRYIFERLYFGDKNIVKKLLPKRLHSLKINLIEPESSKGSYRADLNIYFKGKNVGIPVEVKWNSSSKIGDNQITYLKDNNGFLISFDDYDSTKISDIDSIVIDKNDFTNWIQNNISKLTRESLIYQANTSEIPLGTQHWLVFLRGGAHQNWKKMLNSKSKKSFWAFRQNRKALRHIFDIQKGDKMIFIIGFAKGENQGIKNNPKFEFQYSGWYETTVTEPYYMNLENESGNFFESDISLTPGQRKWPHFIDFEIEDSYEGPKINYGKRGELSKAIADSNNNGFGTPAPISNREYLNFLDKLRFQKS